jgi:hypothetical protein
MSKLEQMVHNDTSSGIDKSELDVQSRGSHTVVNLSIPKGRTSNKVILWFLLIVYTLYRVGVPLLCSIYKRGREQLAPQNFLCHAWDNQERTQVLKLH